MPAAKPKKNLYEKVADIIASLPSGIEPEGRNPHFKYKYYTESQVSALFRERFAYNGIVMIPEVLSYEIAEHPTRSGQSFLTTMLVRFTISDGQEEFSGTALGQGDDPGDKGANKAFTAATKYFLLKLGLIGGDSDAEADEGTDRRTTNVSIEDSDIKGIKRGGRSTNATEAQVKRVRVLAGEIHYDPLNMAILIGDVLDKKVDLGESDPGPPLVEFLGTLKAEEIGALVTKMVEIKERQKAEEEQQADDTGSY